MKRAFIFDPFLGKAGGHWESYSRRLSDELQHLGYSVTAYCRNDYEPAVLKGLNVVAIFPEYVKRNKIFKESFLGRVNFMRNAFNQIDPNQFKKDDVLIFPTVFPFILSAALDWLKSFIKIDGPKALFIFQFSPVSQKGDKKIIKRFKNFFIRKFLLSESLSQYFLEMNLYYSSGVGEYLSLQDKFTCAQNTNGYYYFGACETVSRIFELLTHLQFLSLPMPGPLDKSVVVKDIGEITVGYFGFPTPSKGFKLLPEIVANLGEEAACKWIFQLGDDSFNGESIAALNFPKLPIEYHLGYLELDKLQELMRSVSITLLPYDKAQYKANTSGIFTESLTYGNVLVIPSGTWMEEQAIKYGAGFVAFDEFNAESVAKALKEAIRNISILRAKAKEAAERFQADHNIRNVLSLMLKAANIAS